MVGLYVHSNIRTQRQGRARSLSDKAGSLGVGSSHACALLASRQVACWGDKRPRSPPVAALSGSDDVTCTALRSGELRCWGRNDNGSSILSHATR
jgi:hypothetical protein